MLLFHGLRNQDPFINRSHVSTLSGGKGGGGREKARERRTRVAQITMTASMYSKFSTFRPKFDPKSFDPDCRSRMDIVFNSIQNLN